MSIIIDAPIASKVDRMRQRVQLNHPDIVARAIDQTALYWDDGYAHQPEFSFLVIGDSGAGPHMDHYPQRRIAEQLSGLGSQILAACHQHTLFLSLSVLGSVEQCFKFFYPIEKSLSTLR